jgi:transcriptional regulator with XRE-family HTH domain
VLTTARDDLERELQDPEFRKLYGAAEAKSELAIAIADARHSLRLTQEEMSKKVGASQPYIAKLESGEANPTFGAIGGILAILNLRLAVGITPLLPKPNIMSSGDTFIFDTTVTNKWVADTNAAIMIMAGPVTMVSHSIMGQQGALFPIENYNFFTNLAKVDDSSLVPVTYHSSEEINIGGQRA